MSPAIVADLDSILTAGRQFQGTAIDLAATSAALGSDLFDPGTLLSVPLDPGGAARAEADLALGVAGLLTLSAKCEELSLQLAVAAAEYAAADVVDATVRDAVTEAMAFLLAHPAAVDVGMVILGATPIAGGIEALEYLSDGQAEVRAAGIDAGGAPPPRSVADVIAGLARRDEDKPGTVDVRFLWRPDGSRVVIVDIPGTKSLSPLPGSNVTNLVSDVRAVDGASTSYERGVLKAMREAGVGPHDQVMLVGHSLGGMVAVNAARHNAATGEFHITNVITAGAPIGRAVATMPKSVQVLALENEHDIVPHLDGAKNPTQSNVTTVEFDGPESGIGADHSLDKSYVPGAGTLRTGDDPAVQKFLASAAPFFDASDGVTERYVIHRRY